MANGSCNTSLQHNNACPVPQGLLLPSGMWNPLGNTESMSWKTYSTSTFRAILSPINSLKSFSISFFIMKTILSKPALIASYAENSKIASPLGPNGSICFNPPYRLPIPAAKTTNVVFIFSPHVFYLHFIIK